MRKEIKTILFGLITALAILSPKLFKGQNTLNSYTATVRFLNSDVLQMYQGARIAAPTMTLPNSISTYTSTQPFVNTDNLQVYNAIRGIGDAISGYTASGWGLAGNALANNTSFLGSTTNRSLLFYTNSIQRMKLDSNGILKMGTPTYTDTNIWSYYQGSGNNYYQSIWHNTSNGANASTDLVISNNLGTKSTYFGNFGMNSSTFTGSTVFSKPNAVYLTAQNGDLATGTTSNNSIYSVVNNSMVTKQDSLGNFYIGNATTPNPLGIGRFRVNHGGLNVDIGSHLFGFAGMHITSTVNPNYTNFAVYGDGLTSTYFNSPTDSAVSVLTCGNSGVGELQIRGNQRYKSTPSFQFNSGYSIRNTAGANVPKFILYSNTSGWLTGNIPTQYNLQITAPTYSAVGASTITDAFTQYNNIPVASTNMVITNRWGYGTNASAVFSQSVLIGAGARTPSAALDVSGTMSITSTSTLTGLRNNGTFTTTGAAMIGGTTAGSATLHVLGTMSVSSTSTLNGVVDLGTLNTTGASTLTGITNNGTLNVTGANTLTTVNATGAGTFVGVLSTSSVVSTSKTAGIGYAVGSGSTVTQATSRTTGVTINDVVGSITLFTTAGSATYQSFTVTNSTVAANDLIIVNQRSGTDTYIMSVTAVAAGSFRITFATTGGTTSEAPVFNFAVIKGATN